MALRRQERKARNTSKAIQLSQNGKNKASRVSKPKFKRRQSVVGLIGNTSLQKQPEVPPSKVTRCGRNVALPSEFSFGGNRASRESGHHAHGHGIFFVINIVGNFGTVFCDNGYYNKAIAASPVHALPGYIAGGLSWFAIPWLAATTMGLAAIALESNPVFPTYPNRMDPADVSAGLVLPTAATALMGTGGAVASILLVFMAVTSAMSAELIAVSSIFTYDVYQTYINPKASGKMLINTSHTCVIAYALVMASFSTGLHYIGISMGYLYLLMGVIISSAVLPASLTLMWRQQNWAAATFTPVLGLACSLISWLVTAKKQGGSLSVATTGANDPMLAGNVVALLSPLIFIPALTHAFKPQNYNWHSMKEIKKADDHDLVTIASLDVEEIPVGCSEPDAKQEQEQALLMRAAKITRWLTVFLTIALLVLWPMPMYGSSYIFSKSFFTGWIVVGILWMFCSVFCVGLYPLWEGRRTMKRTAIAIYADITGRKSIARQRSVLDTETASITITTEKVNETMKGAK